MNYVLIVLMTVAGGSFRPPSVVTAEFHRAEACNKALDYFQNVNKDKATFIAGGCFPK